jgi:hypothetical protein
MAESGSCSRSQNLSEERNRNVGAAPSSTAISQLGSLSLFPLAEIKSSFLTFTEGAAKLEFHQPVSRNDVG